MIKDTKNKISKLKCEIVVNTYYKNLEKAPIHLLREYWKQPENNLYSELLNNKN